MVIAIPAFVTVSIMTGVWLAFMAARRPSLRKTLVRTAWTTGVGPIVIYGIFLAIVQIAPRLTVPVLWPFVILALLFIASASFGFSYPLLIRSHWVISAVAAIVLFACLSGSYFLWTYEQCRVTVTNASGQTVSNCLLVLNGPTVDMGTLKSGQKKTVRVFPRGESGLEFTFEGPDGRPGKGVAGYIEPKGYHVRFTVGPDGQVTTR